MSPAPFYEDGQVTIYCADLRDVHLDPGCAAAVVTSPPYNVGLDYHDGDDALAWHDYWSLATAATGLMARALDDGGRAWVNTAVSVPERAGDSGPHSGSTTKHRVMLAHGWANTLTAAGLGLADQVAWCSPRGAGTA